MIKGVMTIFFSLSTLSLSAQTSNVEREFKAQLERVSSENSTISCDFTQIRKVKNIKQPIENHGQFFYDNRGFMALIYAQPRGDKVVMNGELFTVVSNGRKLTSDASSNPMMTQISFMMQACMSGNVSKLGRGWDMSIAKNEGGYQVVLSPTDGRVKKYISGMIMLFDKTNITLNQLRIEERTGGYTEYRFANKKLNQQIDRSYFEPE